MINKWDPIDTVDALELLTPQFTNKFVRHYAVSRLKQASDEVVSICNFINVNVITLLGIQRYLIVLTFRSHFVATVFMTAS